MFRHSSIIIIINDLFVIRILQIVDKVIIKPKILRLRPYFS
jgi:hypothetical protein